VAEELGISIKAIEKHISAAKKQIGDKLVRQFPIWAPLVLFWLE